MRIILTTILLMFTLTSFSQEYDGVWAGTITMDDDKTRYVVIYIENDTAYIVQEDKGVLYETTHDVDESSLHGGQLTFFWMNKSKFWTETQLFILSFTKDGELSAKFVRRVNSCSEDKDCEAWGYDGEGTLEKL